MAKKKADIPQDILKLMHPDLPFDDSSVEEPTERKGKASEPDYAAQMAELNAKLAKLEENNATLQRTNLALMGQPMVAQQPNFGPMEVNLDNLPDPVTNPKEYAQQIVQRGDAVLRARQEAQNWQNQQSQNLTNRVDAIWEQFAEQHPGLAAKTELVEAAAGKAVERAKAQGMDANRYMFAATPQFFSDIVSTLNGWGIKDEDAGETEEADDKETGRTAGIPGGLDSGGRLSAGKDPDDERIPTLMEEVRGWKMKTGFM